MSIAFQEEKIHEGKNLKRIREIMGLKQDVLGHNCPSQFSQQRISEFEKQWTIEEPALEELAEALGVSIEFIRSFNEERAIYNIQTNRDFRENATAHHNYQPTFNYQDPKEITPLLLKLIEEDKIKTQAIFDLTKMVADLVAEVRDLKKKG